jgi:coenzyme PQQ biosynthesis protein C
LSESPHARLSDADALEAALRRIGAARYHWHHPFHKLLHAGELDKGQVQAWALNRYYYQSRIPMKDAALLARVSDPVLRRSWAQRIVDHDGTREGQGGIAAWLRLCADLGLDRAYVTSEAGVHPTTRHAVDAYVQFVASRPLLEAIASSLTELFAPTIIKDRVAGMLRGYSFVDKETLGYFEARLTQAPRDADFALAYVKAHADTEEKRRAVCDALIFKCDVLWSQLDALHYGYVLGGALPAGAFRPESAAEAAA